MATESVSIEVSGIEGIKRRLDNILQKVKSNNDDSIGMRLGKIASEEAEKNFRTDADYDGFNDVVVSPARAEGKNTVVVDASGSTVLFIEFGTGVHYSEPEHPLVSDGTYPYVRGGYGHHLGRLDSWRYEGDPGKHGEVITSGPHAGEVLTHGNPANMCMYKAGKKVRQNLKQVATEVLTSP